MKKMIFVFKGLVKASLLLVVLLSAQSMNAQATIGTQPSASALLQGSSIVLPTSVVSESQAVINLKNEVASLQDQAPSNDFEENSNALRMDYYSQVAAEINNGQTVRDAFENSIPNLRTMVKAKSELINVSAEQVLQSALDLVAN